LRRARSGAGTCASRRIERDLHDGAQQRLVSLALQLRSAASAVPPGADDLATQLAGVRAGLSSALEELREITRGLHPATLAEGGLTSALKGLARRSAIPVRLHVGLERRLPETVELAVYYAVAEVLTNTAKHAGASVVDLTLTADENRLRVEIHDDGAGGARVGSGSGLVGLIDRVEALGGRLRLHSPPGAGTTVTITLPLGLPGPIQPAPAPRPEASGRTVAPEQSR
jgi:signal transduction histidine kinase